MAYKDAPLFIYTKDRLQRKKRSDALKRWYKRRIGQPLNLQSPKTFTEKIQWSKLYDHDPLRTNLTDKYAVREFVAKHIGAEYLIPLLAVWKDAWDIDFDTLPKQFVLKCNHGCAMNIMVKDKTKLNIAKARKLLNLWLKINYGYNPGMELHYADITPCIIAEEYVKNNTNEEVLAEYKFFCFNGEPHYCRVGIERPELKLNWYDMEWNLQPWNMGYYENTAYDIPKPESFENMVSISKMLSKGFSHVRVDLYDVNGKIYFSEMTFTSGSGSKAFFPSKYDAVLGSLWTLPER